MNSSIVERLRSTGRLDRVFIDGEWVVPQGQARSSVIDPSTEAVNPSHSARSNVSRAVPTCDPTMIVAR